MLARLWKGACANVTFDPNSVSANRSFDAVVDLRNFADDSGEVFSVWQYGVFDPETICSALEMTTSSITDDEVDDRLHRSFAFSSL